MSVEIVDLASVRELIAGGAQLVEVLPADEYQELHPPGAINIPLKQLDHESVKQLDAGRETVAVGDVATGWRFQAPRAPACE